MWPDGRAVSMDAVDPRTILVVEWPHSGIHWMEPRDIGIEEFLEWFSSGRRGFHGRTLMYVDVGGQVGELKAGTDRQQVLDLLSR